MKAYRFIDEGGEVTGIILNKRLYFKVFGSWSEFPNEGGHIEDLIDDEKWQKITEYCEIAKMLLVII